jgi:hypothetical protein
MDSTEQTELRLVGVSEDGQRLVLSDPSGAERTVAIDERLRAAVNGHLSRLGQLTMALESRISPKEIQTRVRAGESAEHVALTAGVPLERVLRFVGPVLREREHVAEQARRARLVPVNASGVTGGPASLLGDLIDRVTTRRGVGTDDVNWDSARRDDHSWLITVSWPDGAVACWSLDLLRHQVTPLDAPARRISGQPAPEPDLAQVDADPDPFDEPAEPAATNVRAFARRPATGEKEKLAVVELTFDDGDHAVDSTPDSPVDDVPDAEVPAEAADVVEGTSTPPVLPAAPRTGRPGSKTNKRASVPNWDDIVFGMKPKE